MNGSVLVTGGAGYIGSHTCVELVAAGYRPVILDDFSNSREDIAVRLRQITGSQIPVIRADAKNRRAVLSAINEHGVSAVIHFAGFKSVAESTAQPLKYYRNNVGSTIALLECMQEAGVNTLVFSSSATVYAESSVMPLHEGAELACSNPYGWSKLMSERVIMDACAAAPQLSGILLRYFNPIGAHGSGLIGDLPDGLPNNLMPYIVKVARGELPELAIYGADYPTPDGTGVRDYIHVLDLARAHVLALGYAAGHPGAEAINIGRGQGSSVLEVVRAFESVTGQKVPYRMAPRRPGDIALYYAGTQKAKRLLGFQAQLGLEQMCLSAWNYGKNQA